MSTAGITQEAEMDNSSFRDRYGPWAIIAGASQGLGAAYATQLAARGLNLVLIARNAARLRELATQLQSAYPVQVRSIVADLAQADAITQVADQTTDLDIGLLVYNAALSLIGPFLTRPVEDHLREIDTNVRSPLLFAHYFGRRMLARKRGGIIFMSSLSSLQGSALIANYGATKAYNQVLAEGLWDELSGQGIDVLVCSASAIQTPNYLSSRQDQKSAGAAPAMTPEAVATEAVKALGHQPLVIPGATNRLMAFVMQHLLPRTLAIRIMGRAMRSMYPAEATRA
jgi:short-subunit dehydrogenase